MHSPLNLCLVPVRHHAHALVSQTFTSEILGPTHIGGAAHELKPQSSIIRPPPLLSAHVWSYLLGHTLTLLVSRTHAAPPNMCAPFCLSAEPDLSVSHLFPLPLVMSLTAPRSSVIHVDIIICATALT